MALVLGMLIAGCCQSSALAPRASYEAPSLSFRPVVLPSATPEPTPRPTRKPRPTARPTPKPAPKPKPRGHVLRGAASWYCRSGVSRCHYRYPDQGGFDAYAAAGPALRRALGDWRGRIVWVNGIRVKLIDWCQCYKGERLEKVIDLYYDVFRRSGGRVVIRW